MKKFALLAIAGSLLASTATVASAAAIRFTSGGLTCLIEDNAAAGVGAGCANLVGDGSAELGAVSARGNINGWRVLAEGLSKPVVGNASSPAADLVFSALSSSAGMLTIEFTDTGYLSPSLRTLLSEIGGTAQVPLTSYQTFADLGNRAFARTIDLSTFNLTPTAFGGAGRIGSANFNPGLSPYSVTQVLTFTSSAGGQLTTGDASVGVPAPATLLLLGSALFGLGLTRRNRK